MKHSTTLLTTPFLKMLCDEHDENQNVYKIIILIIIISSSSSSTIIIIIIIISKPSNEQLCLKSIDMENMYPIYVDIYDNFTKITCVAISKITSACLLGLSLTMISSLSFLANWHVACELLVPSSTIYKKNNMTSTRKWHIFIYKESTYTCTCICSCNYIAIQKFATCIRNTHSSFKYCPVATDDMSFPNFMTIEYRCTKHASDISQTFMTKPFMILHFSCYTKYFHHCWMCSHKCWWTWLHLLFCLFHSLLIIFYFMHQML